MMFVYPLGTPLLYLALLREHSSTLCSPEAMAQEEVRVIQP
jgi:hypothetical protein